MKRVLTFFLFVLSAHLSLSQVTGFITDENGEALAYATIQEVGTTNGAVTNLDGFFSFYPEEKGNIQLSIRFIGYETKTISVDYQKKLQLDIVLSQESNELNEVVISADREDPAYAIMRKAIAKRKAYFKTTDTLSANVYIKGRFQLDEVPDNFIGKMILKEDMVGLDSAGRGIVYLSESISRFDRIRPNKNKEVVEKYNVTGIDVPYSFNTALGMDFSIYDTKVLKGWGLVSPLANNAMSHYKFELLYSGLGEDGVGFNKIKVMPKFKSSPAMSGIVYVRDESFHLYHAKLVVDGKRAPGEVLDTMKLELQSILTEEGAFLDWYKNVEMSLNFFGVKPYGSFHAIYSDVKLNKKYSSDFFNREIFSMEHAEANQNMTHWDTVRPIVLVDVETIAYDRHDSLKLQRKLRADSLRLDREKNKPSFMSLLGHTFYLKNGKSTIGHNLINEPDFNSVQGFSFAPELFYSSRFDSLDKYNSFRANMTLGYGFKESVLRPMLSMKYKWANFNKTELRFNIGRELAQYNQQYPVPKIANSIYTLVANKNYAKYFEQDVVELGFAGEIRNGLYLDVVSGYHKRRSEHNVDIKTWEKGGRKLTSNDPLMPSVYGVDAFEENDELFISSKWRLRIKQKYYTFPDRRISVSSKWPDIWVLALYKYNLTSKQNIARLQLTSYKNYNWGHKGYGRVLVRAGKFLFDKPTYFVNYKHFRENNTWFGNEHGFNRLPYFSYSTNDQYASIHVNHNFQGFIWKKLPLLRALNFHTSAEFHALTVPDREIYSEVAIGIGNIGFKVFRPLKIRYVIPLTSEEQVKPGFVFNLSLRFN